MTREYFDAALKTGRWSICAAAFLALAVSGFGEAPKRATPAPYESKPHGGIEPSAPDLLNLVVVATGTGIVTLEAVIKPAFDTTAELEMSDPGGAKLQSGLRTKKLTLRRGGTEDRERVQVDVSDGKPRTVKATLRLLGADGKAWLTVDRQVQLNQPQSAAGEPKVPIVQTLPDGTRIVEYISQKEALSRGLPPAGKPAPTTPKPAAVETLEK